MRDEWLCCWNIFDKSLYFRYISFKSKFSILSFYITVIFIHFYNVFALDSLKISSVLHSRLPGPRWRVRSHMKIWDLFASSKPINSPIFFALMIKTHFTYTDFEFLWKKIIDEKYVRIKWNITWLSLVSISVVGKPKRSARHVRKDKNIEKYQVTIQGNQPVQKRKNLF